MVAENPLSYSLRVQSHASVEGFDWGHVDGVLDKVEEELGEIRMALQQDDLDHARRELGDLLLVSVNLARFLSTDPGVELCRATERFECRFEHLLDSLAAEGKALRTCSPEAIEARWQRVKPIADKLLMKRLDMHPEDGANSSSVLEKTLEFKGRNEPVDNS